MFLCIAIVVLLGVKFGHYLTAYLSLDSDDSIFQPKVHRVLQASLPIDLPFVGSEGRDHYGYPLKTADKTALLRLLRAHKFVELNNYLTQYHDASDKNFRNEYWAYDSADAFHTADPAVGRLIERWTKETPNHFAPYLASARHFAAKGWYAKARNEVPFLQSTTLQSHFARASEDAKRALDKRSRLISAWRTLIKVRMVVGDHQGLADAYKEAEKSCPPCWSYRFLRLMSLRPEWTGNTTGFVVFAEKTLSQKEINPRFAAAEALVHWLRSQNLRDVLADRKLSEGLEVAENFYLREERARVRTRLKHFEAALLDTEIGLKSRPQNDSLLRIRADILRKLERVQESAPILLTLGRLDPTDSWLASIIPWTVNKLVLEAKNEVKKGNHTKSASLCALAQDLGGHEKPYRECQEGLYENAGALPALQAMVEKYPDDFRAHRHLDYALIAANKPKKVLTMWNSYLARSGDDARAIFERAGTLHHLGKRKLAKQEVKRACKLGLTNACKVLRRL